MPMAPELYQPAHGTLSLLCIGPFAFVECIMHFCKKKAIKMVCRPNHSIKPIRCNPITHPSNMFNRRIIRYFDDLIELRG
jgi:hypothetical protein